VTGEARRLLTYCRVDLAVTLLAATALIAMRLWVIPGNWLNVLIGIAFALAAVFAWAAFLTARSRTFAGLLVLTVGNWVALTAFTALVPFTLEFSSLFILIPALLAIPYLSPAGIRGTFAGALIAVSAAAALGRFHHGVGLEAIAPTWNLKALELLGLPTGAGLAGYVSWQNHRTLVSRDRAVRASRARLVASTDQERRRIERDLHDGAQQHLVAAAMQLRVIHRLAGDPGKPVEDLLTQVGDGLHQAIVELRDLAHGIYPAQLTDHGLEAALRAAVLDCPLPVEIHARGLGRCPADIETNAYFACVEAIQNATKHAGSDAAVRIDLDGRHGLTIDITDTGPGADPHTLRAGHGITNITDRIAAIGGTLTIHSHTGHSHAGRPALPADTNPSTPRKTGIHLHAHIPAVPTGHGNTS
jgi:signal transduction histidine kinase